MGGMCLYHRSQVSYFRHLKHLSTSKKSRMFDMHQEANRSRQKPPMPFTHYCEREGCVCNYTAIHDSVYQVQLESRIATLSVEVA
jgi:hypothetical protein